METNKKYTQEELNEAVQDLDKFIQKINAMMVVVNEGRGSTYFKLRLMQNIVDYNLNLIKKDKSDDKIKEVEEQFEEYLKFKNLKFKIKKIGEENE